MQAFFLILNMLVVPAMVILAGLGLRVFAVNTLPRPLLLPILFPGVVIHELSHAVACLPALAKIRRMVLFRADGSGEVVHDKPRLPVVGQLLISLAPIVGGLISLWAVHELLGRPFAQAEVTYAGRADNAAFPLNLIAGTIETIGYWIMHVTLTSWRFWLMLVFGISISLSIVPSRQDLKNAAPGIATVLVVAGAICALMAQSAAADAVVLTVSALLVKAQSVLLSMVIAFLGIGVVWLIRAATGSKTSGKRRS